MNKHDKIKMSILGVIAASVLICGKLKERKDTEKFNYKEIEISIPLGCKNLMELCKTEYEMSQLMSNVFWKLRHMDTTSNPKYYTSELKNENSAMVDEIDEDLSEMDKYFEGNKKEIKRIPTHNEVRKFILYMSRNMKNIDNLKRSLEQLKNEETSSNYNKEYVKAVSLTVRICKKYLRFCYDILKIMDIYLIKE